MSFAEVHGAQKIATIRPRHFSLNDQSVVNQLEHPFYVVCENGIAFVGTEPQILNFKHGLPGGDPQSYEYRRNIELMRRGRI